MTEIYSVNVSIKITGNFRLGDIIHNFADINKIQTELKFNSQWTIEQGFAAFGNWVNQQQIFEDKFDISVSNMKRKGLFK